MLKLLLWKIWKHLTFDISQESFLLELDGAYVSAGTLGCPKGSLACEGKTSLNNNLVISQDKIQSTGKNLFHHQSEMNVAIDKKMQELDASNSQSCEKQSYRWASQENEFFSEIIFHQFRLPELFVHTCKKSRQQNGEAELI